MKRRRNFKTEPLTESEKADPAFMRQYNFEKAGRRITAALSAVAAVSLAAIALLLVLRLYYAALFVSPIAMTALTMLSVNIFIFGNKDVNAPPQKTDDASCRKE